MSKLPEGWKTETIGNFCDILDNQRVPISSEKRAEIQGDIPYYGANGVQDYINDFIFNETLVLLAEDGGHFHEYQTRPIAYMVHGKSWVNNHTHVLRAKNGENYFLYYSLVHKDITSFINGGTRAKLNRGELIKIPLTIPPLEEQKKIAEILSTVDQKIAFVDNRIEESELLKKGLMQKLLTEGIGHTEFKDSEIGRIPVEWEVVELKKYSDIYISNVDKKTVVEEKSVRLCNYMDTYNNSYITNNLNFMQSTASTLQIEKFSLQIGDIMITKDSETKSDIARSAVVIESLDNVLCGYHLALIRPYKNRFDSIFLKKLFDLEKLRKHLISKANGTTRFGLNVGVIENFLIPLPPLEEQKQIAQILSTTDEKLENLKAKKESFEELKKGLMQKLLTGEVRV